MPIITLPDGNNIDFPNKVTGLEVAEKISKSLAKQAMACLANDLLIFSATSSPVTLLGKSMLFPSGNVIIGI